MNLRGFFPKFAMWPHPTIYAKKSSEAAIKIAK